jgi:CRP-like cAMP-binding protein
MSAPVELIREVPIFEHLSKRDLERLAKSFHERTFAPGETIAREGQSGVGFFVIESGDASVTREGEQLATLGAGNYFGEIALIDDGARTATVTANSQLKCYGLTSWEFRPLVEENASIAWELLQVMAKRLRVAEQRAG